MVRWRSFAHFTDQHSPFAANDSLAALIHTDRFEGHDWFAFTDGFHSDARGDLVAGKDGSDELKRLAQVDAAFARQFVRQHRRDERSSQHAVSNAAAKPGLLRKRLIDMNGIVIASDVGKRLDVGLLDLLRYLGTVADLELHFSPRYLSTAALKSIAFSMFGM